MPYPREALYHDVAQVQHRSHDLFGSGRLIGRNLVLTARHVLVPGDATTPIKEGWQVRLRGDRPNPTGTDKWTWIDASVVWAGQGQLDLALLELHPQKCAPDYSPKLKARISRVDKVHHHYLVLGLGFPRGAKVDNKRTLFVPFGDLTDEDEATLSFGIDQAYQPQSSGDWGGFSGGAVLLAESPDPEVVWIYGVAQQVPPSFNRRLDVARLAKAWEDKNFCARLQGAIVSLEPPADPIVRRGSVRRPFTTPTLPEGFVPRADITRAMVTALLTDEKAPLAIHGGGGFGKTTLASSVCHEPKVIEAFPDGIVWVELKEKNSQVERIAEIYAAFTGPMATTVVGIREELKRILSSTRCLIVVDDVWNEADLKPFVDLGARRLMFTTRMRELAGDRKIEITEMNLEESVQLLVRGMPEAASHQKAIEDFTVGLGGWALLLELANARLLTERRRGGSFEAVFDYVTELYRRLGVTGFDRLDTKERNKAVARCLDVGMEAYKESIPSLRVRTGELGLFPEDVPIPESVLSEFWDCGETPLREQTLRYLDDLSMIRWDRLAQVVRLHDLVRATLATWVPDKQASHRRLLDAWGDAMHLPHDYAWRWYGWHCVEAGDPERLRKLLLTPPWLQAKLDSTDLSALVADCERVIEKRFTGTRNEENARTRVPIASAADLTIRLLSEVLMKSAHVLAQDPSQLREQLFGRLRSGISPELDNLFEQLLRDPARRGLRSRFPNLQPVGSPLVLTLLGHESAVAGALLLPDGKRALSWSSDNTLRLWDLATGKQIGEPLTGHENNVWGALLLPDGKRALSWSSDNTLRLWDLEKGEQIGKALAGHKGEVAGALLLPDGKRALSWGDQTLRLWDLETGPQLDNLLAGHQDAVLGALLLPDGKRVLSWSRDNTLRRWDLETGEQIGEPLTGNEGLFLGALLLPDGKRVLSWSSDILSRSRDNTLRLWDLETGKQIGVPLTGHESIVYGVLLLPDGKALSWSRDKTLRLWDLETGKQIGVPLIGHELIVEGALLLPDGKRALSWSEDETLRLWDLETGKQIGEPLTGHENIVWGALLLPDGKRALSWSSDNTLRLWDLDTGKQIGVPLTGHEGAVEGVLLLPDGERALSWSGDLRLWDLEMGQQVGELLTGHDGAVEGALLLPDGKRVLSWSSDNTLRLWDLATGKQIGEPLTGHENNVKGALLLPDEKRALSWSWDRTLRLWDLATGKQIGEPLTGHENNVKGALLLPDGKRALSWSWDRTLRLWDLEKGEQIGKALAGHKGEVAGAQLLPDGKRVLSWSHDHTLRLWGLETGKQIGVPLSGHKSIVEGALLLPDGKRALSWSWDKTLRLWDLETGKQIGVPLIGHEDNVNGALLPNGKRALSWSEDETLRLWDLETGKQIGELLTGHKGSVSGVLLLDGKALSWSEDRTLRLWELATSRELDCFYAEGHVTALVDCRMNRFFAGDGAGRVYFLEFVER